MLESPYDLGSGEAEELVANKQASGWIWCKAFWLIWVSNNSSPQCSRPFQTGGVSVNMLGDTKVIGQSAAMQDMPNMWLSDVLIAGWSTRLDMKPVLRSLSS